MEIKLQDAYERVLEFTDYIMELHIKKYAVSPPEICVECLGIIGHYARQTITNLSMYNRK